MATVEHIVYAPKRRGDPYIVVGLWRTRSKSSIIESFVVTTKAEAERLCSTRQRDLANPPTAKQIPRKLGPSVSRHGKLILEPKE